MNLPLSKTLRLFALLGILSGPAHATHDEDLWQDCTADDQCAVLMGGCDYTAVNADFISPADEYFTEQRTRIRCLAAPGPQPAGATCVKGKCAPLPPAAGFVLDARMLETWTVEEGGIGLRLTAEGQKAMAALTKDNVGKAMEFSVGGTIITTPTIREPLSGPLVMIFFKPDEQAKFYKLFQDHSVCDDAGEHCYLSDAVIKVIDIKK